MSLSDTQDTLRQRPAHDDYKRGYLDALREVERRLSGSAAFNCGRHRGFEYPAELVEAMIKELVG